MFMRVSIIAVIIIIGAVAWFGISKRKDLPPFDWVPQDRGIAVINPGRWFNDKLEVTLLSRDKKIMKQRFSSAGECLFLNLENGREYRILIRRTDPKGLILYKRTEMGITSRPYEGG